MSLEDMLASLEAENQEEVDALINEAKQHAQRTIELAKQEGTELASDEMKRSKEATRQDVRSINSRAVAESRRNKAIAKADVYTKTVSEILRTASSLRDRSDHQTVLEGLLRSALDDVPEEEPAIVICDPKDLAVMDNIMRSIGRSLAVRTQDIPLGGVIVELKEGKVKIDNTLETRIKSVIEAERPHLGEILFGVRPENVIG